MDIFWYTGYVVWLIASICVGIALLVGVVVGVAVAFRRGREWATIRALSLLSGTTREHRMAVVQAIKRERYAGRLGHLDGDIARFLSVCWTNDAIRTAMRPNTMDQLRDTADPLDMRQEPPACEGEI